MNVAIMKEIVRDEVDFMFRDMIETGQGIGTSDISACMNACVLPVNGRFAIDLNILRTLVFNAICDLEEELA